MNIYTVKINCDRHKILLIKMVRAINNWGLSASKIFVEREFNFDEWMTDDVTMSMTLNTEQLGRLTHFSLDQTRDFRIISSKEIYPTDPDPFDFTNVPQY